MPDGEERGTSLRVEVVCGESDESEPSDEAGKQNSTSHGYVTYTDCGRRPVPDSIGSSKR